MTKASDNEFPSLLLKEGTTPSSPAAGDQRLFVRSSDHALCLVNSSGTVTPLAGGSGSITASGYTQATGKLLGRSTASTGAIEEITVGSGLTLSGGSLSASGGGGGLAQSYVGYNTAGGSSVTVGDNVAFLKKVTLAATSHFQSIGAYIAMTTLAGTRVAVGLWADSAGSPSGPPIAANLMGSLGIVWDTPTTPGWFEMPLAKTVAAGDYWIGFSFTFQSSSWRIYHDGSGTDKEVTFSDSGYVEGITYRGSVASASRKYSIRASILS